MDGKWTKNRGVEVNYGAAKAVEGKKRWYAGFLRKPFPKMKDDALIADLVTESCAD